MNERAQAIDADRQWVSKEYDACVAKNARNFVKGDVMAGKEYTYPNQKEDAFNIVNDFYTKPKLRVKSIMKRTKVGMDGLMIELLKTVCTHSDDDFVISPSNTAILTGMANKAWESGLKENMPGCFTGQIYHHGQLKSNNLDDILKTFENGLIIIDEIDTGDGDKHKLFNCLKKHKLTNTNVLYEKNIRFVLVSATMKEQSLQLQRWDEGIHEVYKMTIPPNYITHQQLLDKGIIQEFYQINTLDSAQEWIDEDIIARYGDDFRVHVIRTNKSSARFIQEAAYNNNIRFINHTSDERISYKDLNEIFNNIDEHIIIGIKGFWRRANLIPNAWKAKLGAIMEYCGSDPACPPDVQIQGLPGRLTGYWEDNMLNPEYVPPLIRTSVDAIEKYEAWFKAPYSVIKGYKTNGAKKTFVNPTAFEGVQETPDEEPAKGVGLGDYRIYDNEKTIKDVCKMLAYRFVKTTPNSDGFIPTSLNTVKKVHTLDEAINKVKSGYGTNKDNDEKVSNVTWRTYYPCYVNKNDASTLRYVLIIRPETDDLKLAKCDVKYPQN